MSGKGAAMHGARWNSPGTELIYTAENRSLAMAEIAVHMSMATLPQDYMMLSIEVPDSLSLQTMTVNDLPENWKMFPHPLTTQKVGDEFVIANRCCLLKIPSAVTQGDFNILINPHHPEFAEIKVIQIEKFPFDMRIFK